jgi:hypothetical protein
MEFLPEVQNSSLITRQQTQIKAWLSLFKCFGESWGPGSGVRAPVQQAGGLEFKF